MSTSRNHLLQVAILILSFGAISAPMHLRAQSFDSFPADDDVTTSLGQFQIIVDQALVKPIDAIMAQSPLVTIPATKHFKIYKHGVFTSPTLYDPTTAIGRSDSFISGGPRETAGALAGRAPGRTYITDRQLTVLPSWAETTPGLPEIHTFIKSLNLTDVFSTQVGFSVKAGMLTPTRPVSAGEVEAGSAAGDFPAKSFFNVFVRVEFPALGPLPAIHLVNVEPLLVEQTNILAFPPGSFTSTGIPPPCRCISTVPSPSRIQTEDRTSKFLAEPFWAK